MTPPKPLQWIVGKFENGHVVLKNGNEILRVPRAQMPKNLQEGDVVTAEFYLVSDEQKRRDNLARLLLEEILGNE